jgi:hypothetical protein
MHHGFGNRRRCCTANADSVALYDIVTQRDLSRLFSQLHLVTMKLPLLCNRSISSSSEIISCRVSRGSGTTSGHSFSLNWTVKKDPHCENPIFVRSFRVLPAAAYSSNWKNLNDTIDNWEDVSTLPTLDIGTLMAMLTAVQYPEV